MLLLLLPQAYGVRSVADGSDPEFKDLLRFTPLFLTKFEVR